VQTKGLLPYNSIIKKKSVEGKVSAEKLNAFNACGASKWISERRKLLLFSLKYPTCPPPQPFHPEESATHLP